jgi:hypothetical protein
MDGRTIIQWTDVRRFPATGNFFSAKISSPELKEGSVPTETASAKRSDQPFDVGRRIQCGGEGIILQKGLDAVANQKSSETSTTL